MNPIIKNTLPGLKKGNGPLLRQLCTISSTKVLRAMGCEKPWKSTWLPVNISIETVSNRKAKNLPIILT